MNKVTTIISETGNCELIESSVACTVRDWCACLLGWGWIWMPSIKLGSKIEVLLHMNFGSALFLSSGNLVNTFVNEDHQVQCDTKEIITNNKTRSLGEI